MLTHERLLQLISYDAITGTFTWLPRPRGTKRDGHDCGLIGKEGYRRIKIDGREYAGARLAWLYVHGKWPEHCVDHINGCRDDDRIINLREATKLENSLNQGRSKNNKSGFKGVCAWRDKWRAFITYKGERYYLGDHDTPLAAAAAYNEKAKELHGEFARLNEIPAQSPMSRAA